MSYIVLNFCPIDCPYHLSWSTAEFEVAGFYMSVSEVYNESEMQPPILIDLSY